MKRKRHVTSCQCKILRAIVDEVGTAEVLRHLGKLIRDDHPDFTIGQSRQFEINKIANKLEREDQNA